LPKQKKKLLSSYCFGISDLVLFFVIVWFSYWLNFKFVFYFTLIEILIFFVFFISPLNQIMLFASPFFLFDIWSPFFYIFSFGLLLNLVLFFLNFVL
jgi:hypothetical protein